MPMQTHSIAFRLSKPNSSVVRTGVTALEYTPIASPHRGRHHCCRNGGRNGYHRQYSTRSPRSSDDTTCRPRLRSTIGSWYRGAQREAVTRPRVRSHAALVAVAIIASLSALGISLSLQFSRSQRPVKPRSPGVRMCVWPAGECAMTPAVAHGAVLLVYGCLIAISR